jgi:hypothetical protein
MIQLLNNNRCICTTESRMQRKPFTITLDDGTTQEVLGYQLAPGLFANHINRNEGWALTHESSGGQILRLNNLALLRKAVAHADATTDIDWTKTFEELNPDACTHGPNAVARRLNRTQEYEARLKNYEAFDDALRSVIDKAGWLVR